MVPEAGALFRAVSCQRDLRYFDAAAFHLYGPLSSYPEFVSGLNAAYAARKLAPKPLWITESGTHCEGYGQVDPVFQRGKAYPFEVNEAFFDRREHSFAQNRLLAEFTVKSAVVMQSLGIARNFPFVLLPYNERGNRKVWGMMTWDYRVTPQFAAYANLCAQLGNLRASAGSKRRRKSPPTCTETMRAAKPSSTGCAPARSTNMRSGINIRSKSSKRTTGPQRPPNSRSLCPNRRKSCGKPISWAP